MSPFWCQRDADMLLAEQLVGESLAPHGMYPIRAMLDAGVHVAFGSDWPVSSAAPLAGIEVAVTHLGLGEQDGTPGIWNADQRITAEEALSAYTLGSAAACGWESVLGTIEVGKRADMVFVSGDPLTEPCSDLRVLFTLVDSFFAHIEAGEEDNTDKGGLHTG
jgi:predicted amidohydrolase YtcJ